LLFWLAFGYGHVDIIGNHIRMEKSSDNNYIIDVTVMVSDHREEITDRGELSNKGISFSTIILFLAFNY